MTLVNYIVGWTLLHFIWQGALIALEAAIAFRLLRRASARARYAVACVALAVMAVSPVITARMLANSTQDTSPTLMRRVPIPPGAFSAPVFPGDGPRMGSRTVFYSRVSPSRVDALLPLVVSLWLVGATALLLRLAGGWWRVRRLFRSSGGSAISVWQPAAGRLAHRLGIARAVQVQDSLLIDTPVVFGWLRPVILLPVAALAQLSPAQVEAILAHELAHVRRHDYIVNVLQTIVETVFFYHPAVWWVSSRIRAEREHCCDDVAVEACGDAAGYAEALTELEVQRTHSTSLVLAATGGPLLARVRHVLSRQTNDVRRTSNAGMVIALALLLIVAGGASQWLPAPQAAQIRVAGIARNGLGPREVNAILGFELFPGPRDPHDDPREARAWKLDVDRPSRRIALHGFTGRGLIRFAYGLPDVRIVGGPSWIDTESIDLSSGIGTRPDSPVDPDWRSLIREALEDRLQLTTHHETRDLPVYALVRANPGALGPSLRPATSSCVDPRRGDVPIGAPLLPPAFDARSPGEFVHLCGSTSGITGMTFERVTMADLATALSQPGPLLDRAVVDRTGLPGVFDVSLDLGFLPASAVVSRHPDLVSWFQVAGVRSIFAAMQEQLGLRLEESTMPSDVLVIDHAVRP